MNHNKVFDELLDMMHQPGLLQIKDSPFFLSPADDERLLKMSKREELPSCQVDYIGALFLATVILRNDFEFFQQLRAIQPVHNWWMDGPPRSRTWQYLRDVMGVPVMEGCRDFFRYFPRSWYPLPADRLKAALRHVRAHPEGLSPSNRETLEHRFLSSLSADERRELGNQT